MLSFFENNLTFSLMTFTINGHTDMFLPSFVEEQDKRISFCFPEQKPFQNRIFVFIGNAFLLEVKDHFFNSPLLG